MLYSLALFAAAVSQVPSSSRPATPVVLVASDLDPCSNGVVAHLNPHGDGFLAVKSSPDLRSKRIDKLFNGQNVYVCGGRGEWLAIIYSRSRTDCAVRTNWVKTLPYTGPCRSGWAHRRWIEIWAG